MEKENARGGWGLVACLALFVLIAVACLARYAAPAPKPADVPADTFSAARAERLLERLLGDGSPRYPGGEASARARAWMVEELSSMGYEPQVQQAISCYLNPYLKRTECARVDNVLARLDGTGGAAAVLFMAHYDSAPSSPGAADDGAGVAALLETARILRAGPAPKNPVIFLLEDGEEPGLLGAIAFAEKHPWAQEVGFVVNLEARGAGGASILFETGPGSAGSLSLYARAVSRPVTTSLLDTFYERLPNDTDFTVFKRRGLPGLNLAFFAKPQAYHRPIDNLEMLDPGSLQHQGDNALELARVLGNADLGQLHGGAAVFFDVLALFTVHWSTGFNLVLALLAALLLAGALVHLGRRRELTVPGLLLGVASWLLSLLVALVVSFICNQLLRAVGAATPPRILPWVAEPGPLRAVFWCLAVGAALWTASLMARWVGFWGLWAGTWVVLGLLGLGLAFAVPGISYLFVVPALVAAVLGLVATTTGSAALGRLAALVPAALAAVLAFPPALLVFHALGTGGGPLAVTLLVLLAAGGLMPLVADLPRGRRWPFPAAAAAGALVAAVLAVLAPGFSAAYPEPLNFTFYQDADSGEAYWAILPWHRIPPAVAAVVPIPAGSRGLFPWRGDTVQVRVAPAPATTLPPPELQILERTVAGDEARVRAVVRSPRGAAKVRLYFPEWGDLRSLTFDGEPIPLASASSAGWLEFGYLGPTVAGLEVEAVLGATDPVDVLLVDESYGLPAGSDALALARPPAYAPVGLGDLTLIGRRVELAVAGDGEGEAAEGDAAESQAPAGGEAGEGGQAPAAPGG